MLQPKGIISASLTPFDKTYSVNEEALRKHLESMVEGAGGVVGPAAIGERVSLSFEDWKRVTDVLLDVGRGAGLPVWSYFGTESFEKTLPYARYAIQAGADGIMLVSPHYHQYPEEACYEYFRDFAKEFPGTPFILNPNPQAGKPLSPQMVARLAAEVKNIVGVKISAGTSIHRVIDYYSRLNQVNLVLIPIASALYPFHTFKFQACISPESNFAHREVVALWNALQNGDLAKAKRLHDFLSRVGHAQLDPQVHFFNIPAGHKAAAEMMGKPLGLPRRPLRYPSPEVASYIRDSLEKEGLLASGKS